MALEGSKLGEATVGVVLYDPEARTVLASINEHASLIPASNMKLFTAGVALTVLGPDFAFETTLELIPPEPDAEPDEPAYLPRLLVRGSGDPAFADPELLQAMQMTIQEFLGVWTDAAIASGAPAFGEIIVDARIFDGELVHESWPREQLNKWYCAGVSGMNFHTNVLHVYCRPDAAGQPPLVTVEPPAPGVRISNRAKSVRRGQQTAWAARRHDTNEITLYGNVRHASAPIKVTVHDAAAFFGRVLQEELEKRDVPVAGVRLARPTETFDSTTVLHRVRSPMSVVLERVNTDSHNLYAEALIKRVGHELTGTPGSWSNGGAIMRMEIQQRLIEAADNAVSVADGSGMSRDNRVTPLAVAEWLAAIARDASIEPAFTQSLATPGGGTLERRFRGVELFGSLHAKSGYLRGVSALSGYLIDESTGRRVIFACIINNRPPNVTGRQVQSFYEDVVGLADDWLEHEVERSTALGG